MTTIRDIAKYSGVSVTTASYALNNTGNISEATRKRVLWAAEELNYHPNAFARNLKTQKTNTIGIFISRFGGSFYDQILEGIHSVVLDTDYELMVCPESRSTRRILHYRQVDGAIVFDSKITSESLLRLASDRFPIVVLDRLTVSSFFHCYSITLKVCAKPFRRFMPRARARWPWLQVRQTLSITPSVWKPS